MQNADDRHGCDWRAFRPTFVFPALGSFLMSADMCMI